MQKSLAFYSLRYGVFVLQLCVALFALGYALRILAPGFMASLPPGSEIGLLVAILILPPTRMGGVFHKNEHRKVHMGEAARLGLAFSVTGIVVFGVLSAIANRLLFGTVAGQGDLAALLADPVGVAILALVVIAFLFVVNTVMVIAGAKGEDRKATR